MRQLSNKCVLNAPEIVIYTGVHGATTQQMRTALVEIVIYTLIQVNIGKLRNKCVLNVPKTILYTGVHGSTTQQMRTKRT